MTDQLQSQPQKDDPNPTEIAVEIVSSILGIYSTMVNSQIIQNVSLPPTEKLASVLCVSDVLIKAHALVLAELADRAQAGPSWLLSAEKIEGIAQAHFERMTKEGR